jgi:hypothetical protein
MNKNGEINIQQNTSRFSEALNKIEQKQERKTFGYTSMQKYKVPSNLEDNFSEYKH